MKASGFPIDSTADIGGQFKNTVGSVASDIVKGVSLGALEGLAEAGKFVANVGSSMTGYGTAFEKEIDLSPTGGFNSDVGDFSKAAGQFLSVFVPSGAVGQSLRLPAVAAKTTRALRGAAAANKAAGGYKAVSLALKAAAGTTNAVGRTSIGRSAIQGATADFLAFGETERRLSNLVQSWEIPLVSGPVGYFLAAEDDDGYFQGRLKNATEGLFLGIAVDAFFAGAKKLIRTLTTRETPEGLQDVVLKEPEKAVEILKEIQKETHEAGLSEAIARAGVTNWKEITGEAPGPMIAVLPGNMVINIDGKISSGTAIVDIREQDSVIKTAFNGTPEDVDALLQYATKTKNEKLAKVLQNVSNMRGSGSWKARAQAKIDAADAATAANDAAKRGQKAVTALAKIEQPLFPTTPQQAYETALRVNAGLEPTSAMKPIIEEQADEAIGQSLDAIADVRLVSTPVDPDGFSALSKEHLAYEENVLRPLLDSRTLTEADAAVIRAAFAASDMWFNQTRSLRAAEANVPGALGQINLGTGEILINGAKVRDARTRRANAVRPLQGATVVFHETMHHSLHRAPESVQVAAKMAWVDSVKSGYIDEWTENTFKELSADARKKLVNIFKTDMDEFIVEHTAWMLTKRGVEEVPEGYLQTIAGYLGDAIKAIYERVREFMGATPNQSLDDVGALLAGLKELPETAKARKRAKAAIKNREQTAKEAEEIQAKFDLKDAQRGGKYDWKKSVDPESSQFTINLSALNNRLKGKTELSEQDILDAITFVGDGTVKSLSKKNIETLVGFTEQLKNELLGQRTYVSNEFSKAVAAKNTRAIGPDNRVVQADIGPVKERIRGFLGLGDDVDIPNTAVAPMMKQFIIDGLNAGQRAFKTWVSNPNNPQAQQVLLETLATTVNNVNLLSMFRNESGRVLQSHKIKPGGAAKLGQFGAAEQLSRLQRAIEDMAADPDFLRAGDDIRMSADPESGTRRLSSIGYSQLSETSQMAVREARRQVLTLLKDSNYDPQVFRDSPWKKSLKLSYQERLVLMDVLKEEAGKLPGKTRKEFAENLLKEVLGIVKDPTPETAAFMKTVLETEDVGQETLSKLAGIMSSMGKGTKAYKQHAKMLRAIQNSEKPTLFSMYMEGWMNFILSGPRTFVTNIVSSALATVARPAEIMIGAVATRNTQVLAQGAQEYVNLIHTLFDIVKGSDATEKFMTTREALASTWKTGLNEFDAGSAIVDAKVGAIPGKLGQIIRLPMRGIATTDELFKQLNIRSMLRGRAIREFNRLGKPASELESYIKDYMEEAFEPGTGRLAMDEITERLTHQDLYEATNAITFTEALGKDVDWVSLGGLTLSNAVSEYPALRLILPFVRTPTNILRKTLALTPLAPTMKSHRARLAGDLGDVEKAKAWGEMILGTSIGGLAFAAASTGVITGYGPRNPNERRVWLDSGARPYSFRIPLGDGSYRYIEYRKLDPVATHMGMAADVVDYIETMRQLGDHNAAEHGESLANALIFAIMANVTNKSYLMGVRDFFDAATDLSDSGVLERYIGQRVFASHIPAAVGSLPAFDDYTREIQGMMDPLWNRVPGLNQQLPVRRDVLGQPISNPNLNRMIPAVITTQQADPVMEELSTIGYGFQRMPFTYKGVDLREYYDKDGRQAYDKMTELSGTLKIGGATLKESLAALIADERYQALPKPIGVNDHENRRVKAIQSVMQQYRMRARAEILKQFPEVNTKVKENSALANPQAPKTALSGLEKL